MEQYGLEDLQCNNLMIYQSVDGYRFTSDSVALANYVTVKKNGILVDLCSGSGVIGILANAKNIIKHVYMVELQETLATMCQKSIEYNKLSNITVMNQKVQNIHKEFTNIHVDTVVCNPPYYKTNAKGRDYNREVLVARNEVEITLEEIIAEAGKLLKDGGKFYLSHKSSRLVDIMWLLRQYNLEPKELKILSDSKNDQVVLVKAVKKGESGLKIIQ